MSTPPPRTPRLSWQRVYEEHTPHAEEWRVAIGPYSLRVWTDAEAIGRWSSAAFYSEAIGLYAGGPSGIAPRTSGAAKVEIEQWAEARVEAMRAQLVGEASTGSKR